MLLSYLRTVVLYLILIAVIRLMGKRQIGQMEASEFVVTMLVANLASIPMQNGAIPLYSGLVPILTVLGVELVLSSLSLKSIRLRKLLCGKPVILIENGQVLLQNLRRARITLDELTGHLREKDVLDLTTVQYAILETDGNLSVFPYPAHKPASAREAGIATSKQFLPVTLVADGFLYKQNLSVANTTEKWVQQFIKKHNVELSEVLLLTLDKGGNTIFLKKGRDE